MTDCLVQVKIWFQNHRYKLKKAQMERRVRLHNAATAAASAVAQFQHAADKRLEASLSYCC